MDRTIILSCLVRGSMAFIPLAASPLERPNILFILADDLGSGDLSCQGGKDIHTPNIDRLFRAGVRFSSFYSNSTVSSPTRAALMTGCYPDMVGVPGVIRTRPEDNWGYLDPSAVTLPQMLQKGGYSTALVGKWHLGLESPNLPNERGFDFFHGFLGDMMDDYMNHRREGINFMRLNREEIDPKGHATDLFADWASVYITQEASAREPFFLYLAFNAPHFPIQPPEEWLSRVREREKGKPEIRQKTIALVEHMDYCIGKVIETLQKTGQYSNTIIIFTSDNGGHLPSGASNMPLRGGKQDMYEGGIRVPACMVWEKMIKPGSVSDQTGCTMDFYPTLCSAAGIKMDHAVAGIDLLPGIISGKDYTKDRTIFFMRREGGAYGGLCYYAALKGGYKLLQNTPYEALQLFNLVSDPLEQHPLDKSDSHFGELKSALAQHIRKAGAVPWQRRELSQFNIVSFISASNNHVYE